MKTRSYGFTLIELLVVIALVAVLVGGFSIAILGGSGSGIQNSERILQGFLLSARTEASSASGRASGQPTNANQASALLLVNNDSSDLDGYLREIYVVHWATDVDGNTGWISQRSPVTLPDGIFFDSSNSGDPSSTGMSSFTISLDTPSAIAQTSGSDSWFFIPYDDRGRLSGLDEFQVVISEGELAPGSTTAAVTLSAESQRGGYLILNTGAIVRFPSQEVI